jgi:hypothetical protein
VARSRVGTLVLEGVGGGEVGRFCIRKHALARNSTIPPTNRDLSFRMVIPEKPDIA